MIPVISVIPVIDNSDIKIYTDDQNRWHRDDGPAYIKGGFRSWWFHGKRHREDGPAIEVDNGTVEWWYNNQRIFVSNLKEFQSYIRNKAFW